MPIIEQSKWNSWVEANQDDYGKACVDTARRVMELLDTDSTILTPKGVHQVICQADKDVDAGGLTGFMAGCVAQMVSACHSRGQEFRVAFNAQHGVSEEKAKGGIVNPAIMTVRV